MNKHLGWAFNKLSWVSLSIVLSLWTIYSTKKGAFKFLLLPGTLSLWISFVSHDILFCVIILFSQLLSDTIKIPILITMPLILSFYRKYKNRIYILRVNFFFIYWALWHVRIYMYPCHWLTDLLSELLASTHTTWLYIYINKCRELWENITYRFPNISYYLDCECFKPPLSNFFS